jgi:hypothetical protein
MVRQPFLLREQATWLCVHRDSEAYNEILAAFTHDGIASEEEIVSDCVHIVSVEQASSERAALYQERVSQAHKEFWEPLQKKVQAAARAA